MTDRQYAIIGHIRSRRDFLKQVSMDLHCDRAVKIDIDHGTYRINNDATLMHAFTDFIDKQLAETERLLSSIVIDVSAADTSTAVQLLNQLKEEGLI